MVAPSMFVHVLQPWVSTLVELTAAIMMRCHWLLVMVVRFVLLLFAVVLEAAVESSLRLVLGRGRLPVAEAVAVTVRNFTPVVEIGLVILGEARTNLLEMDILLVAAPASINALVFFVPSRTEAALNARKGALFSNEWLYIAATGRIARRAIGAADEDHIRVAQTPLPPHFLLLLAARRLRLLLGRLLLVVIALRHILRAALLNVSHVGIGVLLRAEEFIEIISDFEFELNLGRAPLAETFEVA